MVYSINSFVSLSSMRGDEEKVVKETEEEEEAGNIDLNLSLSLNGKFGVEPQRNHRVSATSSHSNVLITTNKRSSPIFDENGAESKMWHSFPTGTEMKEMGIGRKESQSLALLDPNNRRSLGSQGSNSSTISYLQCQTIEGQGFPANIGYSTEKNQGKRVETVAVDTSSKAIPAAADEVKGRVFSNADMPYVFTTVHGRKIEGFLSKYNEEEDISIICACHGCSMTPAEFIKHAGGGDVPNPYRHITINYARGGRYGLNPLN